MNARCYVEVLTPKQSSETLETDLDRFTEKVRAVLAEGYIVSVPDNPMGIPRFKTMEIIAELGLTVPDGRLLVHINTFHTKSDLDGMLAAAMERGVRSLLLVTGDGGDRLAKLDPRELESQANTVTSFELLKYVSGRYPGVFDCGVAFNPYEPQDHETAKLQRKIEAGAGFVVTQPVIGCDKRVDALRGFGLPMVVGAWMSEKLDLLSRCVGYEVAGARAYDPMANLTALMQHYPDAGFYFSMIGIKTQLPRLKEMQSEARRS